ncbi:SpoIIIAH-like family protein [Tumebacillus permanentifrigoris]|uniref:Stage III sporulation protein AH n=1 Tax=Tumebacillus permanentifrigoris TaxID=378543 RepID=A0A316D702_9BACL|nr:SpoIIIAH-like family protein [Tumebacillus permanentifrigoris]PWK11504.1 stage III sporulation protein AH [Tumebacillus permanentifrigoris]
MAKRQTIWLSTMMVLSLMLIGFYTVNNNVKEVSTDPVQQAADPTSAEKGKADAAKGGDKTVMEPSDYFISHHLEESQKSSAEAERLQTVIANDKTPADQVEKAKKDLESLTANQDKIDNAIDKIMAEGYPDAIVEVKDDKVNVTVQSHDLDKKKVVKLMGIVAKEMGVSSSKVVVSKHE